MGTKLLSNEKSHNRIHSEKKILCKSLCGNSLQNIVDPFFSCVSRETPVTHCQAKTYNSQNPDLVLSDPVTFYHCLAGIPTYNNSTIDTENPVGNPVELGSFLSLNNPQYGRKYELYSLFPNPNYGIIVLFKKVSMQPKGPMKNWLFYLVAAWVGVLSASSANVVICVQPSGVARMQLTDHKCCSACCDSTCAACSIPTQEKGCFLHPGQCCQDVVFPFPPTTVVTTVFSSVSPPSPMVSNLSDSNQYNSKIPYIAKDLLVCDPAVNTAILLI